MRAVIVTNIMSLDGFYSDPHGNPLVLNMDASFDAYNLERMRAADTVVLGRQSFDMFSSFWPMVANAPDDPTNPALSKVNREFSRRYNDIPKIVVSDSLEVLAENPWRGTSEVVARNAIVSRIRDERAADGNEIAIFASHILWNGLLAQGVVDEVHLVVGPAAIGEGIPVFTSPTQLALVEARQLKGSDNTLLRYSTVE